MQTFRKLSPRLLFKFTGKQAIFIMAYVSVIAVVYDLGDFDWITIPWLPISLIGTAVAFYIGFKNNSAYDRMWEARKIWGAIVNDSRSWGISIKHYINNVFADVPASDEELDQIKKKLIYRHIAWLYALRSQLLVTTSWEHAAQAGHLGRTAQQYQKQFGVGLVDDEVSKVEHNTFLPDDEYKSLINFKNTATQIIDKQAEDLESLRKLKLIDDFRHIDLQSLLKHFYTHQGKLERIKKFPLPRQYSGSSIIFVGIFVFLLPFGMVSEFAKIGPYGVWLSIPFTTLVGWVYLVMEQIGDYSENPFQGMAHDIPMLSLCRTIEIDLKEMIGEEEIPEPIKAKNGTLM